MLAYKEENSISNCSNKVSFKPVNQCLPYRDKRPFLEKPWLTNIQIVNCVFGKRNINQHLDEHNYFSPGPKRHFSKKIRVDQQSTAENIINAVKEVKANEMTGHSYYLPSYVNNIKNQIKNNRHLKDHNYYSTEKTYFIQSYSLKNNNNHDDVNNIIQEEKKCGVTNTDNTNMSIQHLEEPFHIQQSLTYSVYSGVRMDSLIYLDSLQYKYYRHSIRRDSLCLTCSRKKRKPEFCPGLATISTDFNDKRIKIIVNHNHLPRKVDILKMSSRKALYEKSNSNYSRSHILSDIQRKYLRRRRCKFVNLSSKDNISDIHSYAKNVPCTVPLPEPILYKNENVLDPQLEDEKIDISFKPQIDVNVRLLHLQKTSTYSIQQGVRLNLGVFKDNVKKGFYHNNNLKNVICLSSQTQRNKPSYHQVVPWIKESTNEYGIKISGVYSLAPQHLKTT